jgi:hypothetical protein
MRSASDLHGSLVHQKLFTFETSLGRFEFARKRTVLRYFWPDSGWAPQMLGCEYGIKRSDCMHATVVQ